MTHTQPWGSTHSSSSQVIRSSHLSIFILIFPWWVTVFHFITHFFLIYHLIHHAVLKRNFLEFSSGSWWAIAYWSQKCCLVILDSPHVYKEAVLPQRKKSIKFRFILSSAFFSKINNSTILIIASGLVSKSLESLNHFDYTIRVCLSYLIKLTSA